MPPHLIREREQPWTIELMPDEIEVPNRPPPPPPPPEPPHGFGPVHINLQQILSLVTTIKGVDVVTLTAKIDPSLSQYKYVKH